MTPSPDISHQISAIFSKQIKDNSRENRRIKLIIGENIFFFSFFPSYDIRGGSNGKYYPCIKAYLEHGGSGLHAGGTLVHRGNQTHPHQAGQHRPKCGSRVNILTNRCLLFNLS